MNKKDALDIRYKELAIQQTFLSAAIVDLSSWIKAVDTKISILMAIQGALVTVTLSQSANLYQFNINLNSSSPHLETIFLIVLGLWLVSVMGVFVLSMLTLWPRRVPVAYDSKWFFDTPGDALALKVYMCRLEKSPSKDLINDMSAELFKLNCINKEKSKTSKLALICFSFGLGFHSIILAFCYLYGIWGLNCG